jgi:hypothetical protein
MYYKFFKLINGEDIIAVTDDPCETFEDKEFIDIVDPVLICAYRIPREKGIMETYVMQTWMKMAVQDVISLPVASILIAVDVQPKVIEQYDIFVIEANRSSSIATLEDGYSDDVLEELIDVAQEAMMSGNEEEEEDDYSRSARRVRTFH